ncbi:MAG: GNAT family N-acetyltransferase [Firmicutes bacterium]|nr:GNAT family N-acetyltransferase [Bacillota bacterium]
MYIFKSMNKEDANKIVNWHYEGDYSFYDMESDPEDLEEFLKPKNWKDRYFSVYREQELVGFFSFNKQDDTIVIGLGMRPDLTGKGLGNDFLKEGLEFGKRKFNANKFSLAVATFNKRAIKAYKKIGFKPLDTFSQETNGGKYEFLNMEKKI